MDVERGEIFGIPKQSDFCNNYRVVICTLAASTYLVNGALKEVFRYFSNIYYLNFFSHIIIDEAGQAQNVETLIPIVGLATENTRIVLAGDPKQLGPVQTNNFIKNCGIGRVIYLILKIYCLDESLLERYINTKAYNDM